MYTTAQIGSIARTGTAQYGIRLRGLAASTHGGTGAGASAPAGRPAPPDAARSRRRGGGRSGWPASPPTPSVRVRLRLRRPWRHVVRGCGPGDALGFRSTLPPRRAIQCRPPKGRSGADSTHGSDAADQARPGRTVRGSRTRCGRSRESVSSVGGTDGVVDHRSVQRSLGPPDRGRLGLGFGSGQPTETRRDPMRSTGGRPWSHSWHHCSMSVLLIAPIFPYAKRRPVGTPFTWGEAVVGGTYIFFVMFWIYGVMPHHWLTWADAELELATRPHLVRPRTARSSMPITGWSLETPWFPIAVSAQVFRDIIATLIYVGAPGRPDLDVGRGGRTGASGPRRSRPSSRCRPTAVRS